MTRSSTTRAEPDELVVMTNVSWEAFEIDRRLGVGEVWFWINNEMSVHVLTDAGYELRTTSACLPGFDFALVDEMLALPSLSAVRKALRVPAQDAACQQVAGGFRRVKR